MKKIEPTKAWILICSVIVVTSATAEHSSPHHNGVLHHGANITPPRKKTPNTAVPIGIQMPEEVMSRQEVSCISADTIIFDIMKQAKETCKGKDMICTFYLFANHKYYNLGALEINKALFDVLLMKYDNWLLTAQKKYPKDTVTHPPHHFIKNHKLDTGNARAKDRHNDLPQIDNPSASSELERSTVNPSFYIDKYDHNMYYNALNSTNDTKDSDGEEKTQKTAETHSQKHLHIDNSEKLINVEEKEGKFGNYVELYPKYDKDNRYFEIFLPKDERQLEPKTINVNINNEKNNYLFYEEDIEKVLEYYKPVKIELDELPTMTDFDITLKSQGVNQKFASSLVNNQNDHSVKPTILDNSDKINTNMIQNLTPIEENQENLEINSMNDPLTIPDDYLPDNANIELHNRNMNLRKTDFIKETGKTNTVLSPLTVLIPQHETSNVHLSSSSPTENIDVSNLKEYYQETTPQEKNNENSLKNINLDQVHPNEPIKDNPTTFVHTHPKPSHDQNFNVEDETQKQEAPYVFNSHVNNFNGNQKLVFDAKTENVKSVVNFSKNVVVPNKYLNHAEYYLEYQLNNNMDGNPPQVNAEPNVLKESSKSFRRNDNILNENIDHLIHNNEINNLKLPQTDIVGSDIKQNYVHEETPQNTIMYNDNNYNNQTPDLKNLGDPFAKNMAEEIKLMPVDNNNYLTINQGIPAAQAYPDDYNIQTVENPHIYNDVDFDYNHESSTHNNNNIHLNEPIFQVETPFNENKLISTPYIFAVPQYNLLYPHTTNSRISDHTSPNLNVISSQYPQLGTVASDLHSVPSRPLSPLYIAKELSKTIDPDSRLQALSSYSSPTYTTPVFTEDFSQNSPLATEFGQPSIASGISQYTSPILPVPPMESVMVLNTGSEHSPFNVGFSWLPSFSRIEELRLPMTPLSSDFATPRQESSMPVPVYNYESLLPGQVIPKLDSGLFQSIPSFGIGTDEPSITTNQRFLKDSAPIFSENTTPAAKFDFLPESQADLKPIPTSVHGNEYPLSTILFNSKVGVNLPSAQQIPQSPSSLTKANLLDLGYDKKSDISSSEPIPIFNQRETQIPLSAKVHRYPFATMPPFVQPHKEQILPDLFLPAASRITTLDSLPLPSLDEANDLHPDVDFIHSPKRISILPSGSKTSFIPKARIPAGSGILKSPLVSPYQPLLVTKIPKYKIPFVPLSAHTASLNNGFRNYPSTVSSDDSGQDVDLQQNNFLEPLLATAVPLSRLEQPYSDKDIIQNVPSSYKPRLYLPSPILSPEYTAPVQTDLSPPSTLNTGLPAPILQSSIPLPAIPTTNPLLKKDFSFTPSEKISSLPEPPLISSDQVPQLSTNFPQNQLSTSALDSSLIGPSLQTLSSTNPLPNEDIQSMSEELPSDLTNLSSESSHTTPDLDIGSQILMPKLETSSRSRTEEHILSKPSQDLPAHENPEPEISQRPKFYEELDTNTPPDSYSKPPKNSIPKLKTESSDFVQQNLQLPSSLSDTSQIIPQTTDSITHLDTPSSVLNTPSIDTAISNIATPSSASLPFASETVPLLPVTTTSQLGVESPQVASASNYENQFKQSHILPNSTYKHKKASQTPLFYEETESSEPTLISEKLPTDSNVPENGAPLSPSVFSQITPPRFSLGAEVPAVSTYLPAPPMQTVSLIIPSPPASPSSSIPSPVLTDDIQYHLPNIVKPQGIPQHPLFRSIPSDLSLSDEIIPTHLTIEPSYKYNLPVSKPLPPVYTRPVSNKFIIPLTIPKKILPLPPPHRLLPSSNVIPLQVSPQSLSRLVPQSNIPPPESFHSLPSSVYSSPTLDVKVPKFLRPSPRLPLPFHIPQYSLPSLNVLSGDPSVPVPRNSIPFPTFASNTDSLGSLPSSTFTSPVLDAGSFLSAPSFITSSAYFPQRPLKSEPQYNQPLLPSSSPCLGSHPSYTSPTLSIKPQPALSSFTRPPSINILQDRLPLSPRSISPPAVYPQHLSISVPKNIPTLSPLASAIRPQLYAQPEFLQPCDEFPSSITKASTGHMKPLRDNTYQQLLPSSNPQLNTPTYFPDTVTPFGKPPQNAHFTPQPSLDQINEFPVAEPTINGHPCLELSFLPFPDIKAEPPQYNKPLEVDFHTLQNKIPSISGLPSPIGNVQAQDYISPLHHTNTFINEDFSKNALDTSKIPIVPLSPFVQIRPILDTKRQVAQTSPIASFHSTPTGVSPTIYEDHISTARLPSISSIPYSSSEYPKPLLDIVSQVKSYPQLIPNIPPEYLKSIPKIENISSRPVCYLPSNIVSSEKYIPQFSRTTQSVLPSNLESTICNLQDNPTCLNDIKYLLDEASFQILKDMYILHLNQSPVAPIISTQNYVLPNEDKSYYWKEPISQPSMILPPFAPTYPPLVKEIFQPNSICTSLGSDISQAFKPSVPIPLNPSLSLPSTIISPLKPRLPISASILPNTPPYNIPESSLPVGFVPAFDSTTVLSNPQLSLHPYAYNFKIPSSLIYVNLSVKNNLLQSTPSNLQYSILPNLPWNPTSLLDTESSRKIPNIPDNSPCLPQVTSITNTKPILNPDFSQTQPVLPLPVPGPVVLPSPIYRNPQLNYPRSTPYQKQRPLDSTLAQHSLQTSPSTICIGPPLDTQYSQIYGTSPLQHSPRIPEIRVPLSVPTHMTPSMTTISSQTALPCVLPLPKPILDDITSSPLPVPTETLANIGFTKYEPQIIQKPSTLIPRYKSIQSPPYPTPLLDIDSLSPISPISSQSPQLNIPQQTLGSPPLYSRPLLDLKIFNLVKSQLNLIPNIPQSIESVTSPERYADFLQQSSQVSPLPCLESPTFVPSFHLDTGLQLPTASNESQYSVQSPVFPVYITLPSIAYNPTMLPAYASQIIPAYSSPVSPVYASPLSPDSSTSLLPIRPKTDILIPSDYTAPLPPAFTTPLSASTYPLTSVHTKPISLVYPCKPFWPYARPNLPVQPSPLTIPWSPDYMSKLSPTFEPQSPTSPNSPSIPEASSRSISEAFSNLGSLVNTAPLAPVPSIPLVPKYSKSLSQTYTGTPSPANISPSSPTFSYPPLPVPIDAVSQPSSHVYTNPMISQNQQAPISFSHPPYNRPTSSLVSNPCEFTRPQSQILRPTNIPLSYTPYPFINANQRLPICPTKSIQRFPYKPESLSSSPAFNSQMIVNSVQSNIPDEEIVSSSVLQPLTSAISIFSTPSDNICTVDDKIGEYFNEPGVEPFGYPLNTLTSEETTETLLDEDLPQKESLLPPLSVSHLDAPVMESTLYQSPHVPLYSPQYSVPKSKLLPTSSSFQTSQQNLYQNMPIVLSSGTQPLSVLSSPLIKPLIPVSLESINPSSQVCSNIPLTLPPLTPTSSLINAGIHPYNVPLSLNKKPQASPQSFVPIIDLSKEPLNLPSTIHAPRVPSSPIFPCSSINLVSSGVATVSPSISTPIPSYIEPISSHVPSPISSPESHRTELNIPENRISLSPTYTQLTSNTPPFHGSLIRPSRIPSYNQYVAPNTSPSSYTTPLQDARFPHSLAKTQSPISLQYDPLLSPDLLELPNIDYYTSSPMIGAPIISSGYVEPLTRLTSSAKNTNTFKSPSVTPKLLTSNIPTYTVPSSFGNGLSVPESAVPNKPQLLSTTTPNTLPTQASPLSTSFTSPLPLPSSLIKQDYPFTPQVRKQPLVYTTLPALPTRTNTDLQITPTSKLLSSENIPTSLSYTDPVETVPFYQPSRPLEQAIVPQTLLKPNIQLNNEQYRVPFSPSPLPGQIQPIKTASSTLQYLKLLPAPAQYTTPCTSSPDPSISLNRLPNQLTTKPSLPQYSRSSVPAYVAPIKSSSSLISPLISPDFKTLPDVSYPPPNNLVLSSQLTSAHTILPSHATRPLDNLQDINSPESYFSQTTPSAPLSSSSLVKRLKDIATPLANPPASQYVSESQLLNLDSQSPVASIPRLLPSTSPLLKSPLLRPLLTSTQNILPLPPLYPSGLKTQFPDIVTDFPSNYEYVAPTSQAYSDSLDTELPKIQHSNKLSSATPYSFQAAPFTNEYQTPVLRVPIELQNVPIGAQLSPYNRIKSVPPLIESSSLTLGDPGLSQPSILQLPPTLFTPINKYSSPQSPTVLSHLNPYITETSEWNSSRLPTPIAPRYVYSHPELITRSLDTSNMLPSQLPSFSQHNVLESSPIADANIIKAARPDMSPSISALISSPLPLDSLDTEISNPTEPNYSMSDSKYISPQLTSLDLSRLSRPSYPVFTPNYVPPQPTHTALPLQNDISPSYHYSTSRDPSFNAPLEPKLKDSIDSSLILPISYKPFIPDSTDHILQPRMTSTDTKTPRLTDTPSNIQSSQNVLQSDLLQLPTGTSPVSADYSPNLAAYQKLPSHLQAPHYNIQKSQPTSVYKSPKVNTGFIEGQSAPQALLSPNVLQSSPSLTNTGSELATRPLTGRLSLVQPNSHPMPLISPLYTSPSLTKTKNWPQFTIISKSSPIYEKPFQIPQKVSLYNHLNKYNPSNIITSNVGNSISTSNGIFPDELKFEAFIEPDSVKVGNKKYKQELDFNPVNNYNAPYNSATENMYFSGSEPNISSDKLFTNNLSETLEDYDNDKDSTDADENNEKYVDNTHEDVQVTESEAPYIPTSSNYHDNLPKIQKPTLNSDSFQFTRDPNFKSIAHEPQSLLKQANFYANNHIGHKPQDFNIPTTNTNYNALPKNSYAYTESPYSTTYPEIFSNFSTMPTKHFGSVPKLDPVPRRSNEYDTEIPYKRTVEPLPITNSYPQNFLNPLFKAVPPIKDTPYSKQLPQQSEDVTGIPRHPTSYAPHDSIGNTKYSGYKTYLVPALTTPEMYQIPSPSQIYNPPRIPQSLPSIPQYQNQNIPVQTAPFQTKLDLNNFQQNSKSNEHNPIEDMPVCKDNVDINNELKSGLINYINSNAEVKNNLDYNNVELTIPLGNLAVTKKEPCNSDIIETNNPSIGLKIWKSNVKIVKAEIKLKFKELSVINFMPVVNNLEECDVEEFRRIVKNYINEKYGNHIEINEPYTIDNQYTVIKEFDHNAMDGKYNLLWPTNYV